MAPESPPPRPPLVSRQEAAKVLGVSYQHVRNLIDRGELPYIKVGERILVDPLDLEMFIAERRTFRVDTDLAAS